METILFLLLLGLGIALLMGLRNTQHAAERSRSLAAHLDVELQATRTALLARIDVLEKIGSGIANRRCGRSAS